MTPRQRKLLLIIAARQAEKQRALVEDLARMGAMGDMTVHNELYVMRDLGMVYLVKTCRGSIWLTEVSLTPKAVKLIPRVREIEGSTEPSANTGVAERSLGAS